MKPLPAPYAAATDGFPSEAELAALRAWYAGLPARHAVVRYLGHRKATGQSSRAMLGAIRGKLRRFAHARHRDELLEVLAHRSAERLRHAQQVLAAVEVLRATPPPHPELTHVVEQWFDVRLAAALQRNGIRTLADLVVRVPRRKRWWARLSGIGAAGAARIEALFASHKALTERGRALVPTSARETTPWEYLAVPSELDGSNGTFRAPSATCALSARDDYAAVQAWLSLQESPATQRAYRKEVERLMLWAILERRKPLSSLTTEDAIAYRQFLRRPTPKARWVGPPCPRSSPEWKPFKGELPARSTAYALTVLNALFRWLIEQRYMLVNPFSGVKTRRARRAAPLDASRGFSAHEWTLVRSTADGLEWTHHWREDAAQRLRLVLDFWFATGLRPHELVQAKLGDLHRDERGDHWLSVVGKGAKEGEVAVPLLALGALERSLAQRGLPVSRHRWDPSMPLVPNLAGNGRGITRARLWALMKRFFDAAAEDLEGFSASTAQKLRQATPHWLRHTHASHALAAGADLTTVRDNLRHASIATTSVYLHGDEVKRARQMREAFPVDLPSPGSPLGAAWRDGSELK